MVKGRPEDAEAISTCCTGGAACHVTVASTSLDIAMPSILPLTDGQRDRLLLLPSLRMSNTASVLCSVTNGCLWLFYSGASFASALRQPRNTSPHFTMHHGEFDNNNHNSLTHGHRMSTFELYCCQQHLWTSIQKLGHYISCLSIACHDFVYFHMHLHQGLQSVHNFCCR